MKKGRFLLSFLVAFGAILFLWSRTPLGDWYSQAMLAAAAIIGPLTHGWLLEAAHSAGEHPFWVRGTARVELQIQFDALAVGTVPLLSLFLATPGISWNRRLRHISIGVAANFCLDTAIVVLFPLLVFYQNDFTDVTGTFIGMVGFVGAPVIIWFTVAFADLRQWLPTFKRPAVA